MSDDADSRPIVHPGQITREPKAPWASGAQSSSTAADWPLDTTRSHIGFVLVAAIRLWLRHSEEQDGHLALAGTVAQEGVDGLLRDKTRPSRVKPFGPEVAERIVALTLAEPPGETTHWTGRAMATVMIFMRGLPCVGVNTLVRGDKASVS